MTWLIILGIIVFIVFIVIVMYNKLVKLRLNVKNSWSQIEVQLQMRFDLIPNLVEIVKGYAKHESGVFEKIAKLRTSWANAATTDEKLEIGTKAEDTLKAIMAVAENYPELKANQNFISLQNSLSDTENKIAYARQFYNDSVTIYNTKIAVFPSNIIAKLFGFKEDRLFEAEMNEIRKNVKIDLNK